MMGVFWNPWSSCRHSEHDPDHDHELLIPSASTDLAKTIHLTSTPCLEHSIAARNKILNRTRNEVEIEYRMPVDVSA